MARKNENRSGVVIAITGASSGIGAGLARHYARRGDNVVLSLASRSRKKLVKVAQECVKHGADVEAVTLDTTDRNAVASWLYALGKDVNTRIDTHAKLHTHMIIQSRVVRE